MDLDSVEYFGHHTHPKQYAPQSGEWPKRRSPDPSLVPPSLSRPTSALAQSNSSSGKYSATRITRRHDDRPLGSPPPTPSPNTCDGPDGGGMLPQPETRPLTHEQLVNEVKGLFFLFQSFYRLCLLQCNRLDVRSDHLLTFCPRYLRRPGHGGKKMCGNRPTASCHHQQTHQ
jgi:hypothetical protein